MFWRLFWMSRNHFDLEWVTEYVLSTFAYTSVRITFVPNTNWSTHFTYSKQFQGNCCLQLFIWIFPLKSRGTDLSSLIGKFDFGYFTVWKSNFPATLIYMKSVLADLWGSKTVILTGLEAFNFDLLGEFLTWECEKYPKIQNSEMLICSKQHFVELQNHQNWFHMSSEWHKNPEISTLCFPN